MPRTILKNFLDDHSIKYVTITHSSAYTAQEIAASAHIPGRELAKAVMIKIEGRMAMAVLPASYKISFEHLKAVLGIDKIRLATEQEFKDKFPDCEVGAMPPFGNLYNMNVFVEQSLSENEEIAFNACSHTRLIKMSYKDYEELVQPTVVNFSILSKV